MKSNSKETNRIKEPSKFAIKFANTVFVLGILFSVLISVYSVYKIYNKPENLTSTFYYLYLLFAILTAILFVLGLRKLRDELKVNMSVLFITVGISVYGFETYLEFHYESPLSRKAIAEQMGVPFDTRSKMEMIDDLIDSGINTYPSINPPKFVESNGFNTFKGKIYPLGGISNITTILWNESGYYPIVETDEHGFNNPKGLYKFHTSKDTWTLKEDKFTSLIQNHKFETIVFSTIFNFMDNNFETWQVKSAGYNLDFLKSQTKVKNVIFDLSKKEADKWDSNKFIHFVKFVYELLHQNQDTKIYFYHNELKSFLNQKKTKDQSFKLHLIYLINFYFNLL